MGDRISGCYLRSVLFHISQLNALFRSLISVILVNFNFFFFIASYFPQLGFLPKFSIYVRKMFHSFIWLSSIHGLREQGYIKKNITSYYVQKLS